jgi:predicted DsbA family dithiol-disulfide isomerase
MKQNMADGSRAGVTGTPSFVIGLSEPDGSTVKLKKFIRGAQGYPIFEKTIDELLAAAEG